MNAAVIPAAGHGARIGAGSPKQFAEVCGKPLIIHALTTINAHSDIDTVVIGCADEHREYLSEICAKWGIDKLRRIVTGGATRQATVYACLLALSDAPPDIALIHDAARPLLASDIISENIKAAREHGAANTVIQMSDTVINSADGRYADSVLDRSALFRVQTPQTFRYDIILDAHKRAAENNNTSGTDDCGLVMDTGHPVYLCAGSPLNIKITTPADMEMFKRIMRGGLK